MFQQQQNIILLYFYFILFFSFEINKTSDYFLYCKFTKNQNNQKIKKKILHKNIKFLTIFHSIFNHFKVIQT